MSTVNGMIKLMRPRQWIKNGFVLAPLVFTGRFLQPEAISAALVATLLFCLASSLAYVVNDLQDIEADKRHPDKRKKRRRFIPLKKFTTRKIDLLNITPSDR